MNKLRNLFYFMTLVYVVSACTTTQKTSTASKTYSEDLTEFRPKVDSEELAVPNEVTFRKTKENIKPKNDVTELLHSKLDTLAENNAEIKFVNGYTIQVYSGSSSAEAYEARDRAVQILPKIKTVVKYDQPVYKVRAGSFTERLEVQRTLLKLKAEFPSAISVPERIKVN